MREYVGGDGLCIADLLATNYGASGQLRLVRHSERKSRCLLP